jgi:hypothetical protein
MRRDRQELEKVVKVLRPFAKSADALRSDAPDDETVIIFGGQVLLTAGDFRKAQRVVEEVDQWLQSQ